ncbi:hypothetical protein FP744_10006383 [Trichoderma asperellum]
MIDNPSQAEGPPEWDGARVLFQVLSVSPVVQDGVPADELRTRRRQGMRWLAWVEGEENFVAGVVSRLDVTIGTVLPR